VIDRMVRVDLRTIALDIPPQDLITRDNVPAKVNAVTYFRVVDAACAVVAVERYLSSAPRPRSPSPTLRSVLGKAELDMLLAERERLTESLQQLIDEQTDPWGVEVTAVEIKDVEIPSGMQRAMARQAEAERERRAKIIHAEGEYQASQRLRDAAEVIGPAPAALQLRYFQTLAEVGAHPSSTIVFSSPMDAIRPLLEAAGGARDESYGAATAGDVGTDAPGDDALPARPARLARSRSSPPAERHGGYESRGGERRPDCSPAVRGETGQPRASRRRIAARGSRGHTTTGRAQ
jgi:hypothetical protein